MNAVTMFPAGKVFTQSVEDVWLQEKNIHLDVLRLDVIHPVISGNKWFKLKYYLADAIEKGFDRIATFGGAYSNHIVATAFGCGIAGLRSMGIIRGDEPETLSHTLLQAKHYGMALKFISREEYRSKSKMKRQYKDVYWINEGGYGILGMKGAAEIFSFIDHAEKYTHIVCAAGTGTTIGGLIHAALPHQKIIGISVMKGNHALEKEVEKLLPPGDRKKNFSILHDYHFGGYAKRTPELLQFMNNTWHHYHLPVDFVYTAKTFYAVKQLILCGNIPQDSKVLMIHTGGLQGNGSLPANSLSF